MAEKTCDLCGGPIRLNLLALLALAGYRSVAQLAAVAGLDRA